MWERAHLALAIENFRTADSVFSQLATRFPQSHEGREALFYLGAMRIDPRNPGWSSQAAAEYLRRYLAHPGNGDAPEIQRRAEATTFLELANQLNLPADERVPALQPTDTVVISGRRGVPRVITSAEAARELQGEVERLRREVAERDETIRRQREELNRIRNTLAPGRRP
ncbi:MAG TPA: hypothetical protein VHG28_23465 [Longimicrobiaceae bacterium]|nr:hypothetical protein [Longimicrobiaceae bacterium]